MAAVAEKLSLAGFEEQYGGEKPYYEFWYGQAVQKPVANSIHGLLERILMDLLSEAGYEAGAEITLKIDPTFSPSRT